MDMSIIYRSAGILGNFLILIQKLYKKELLRKASAYFKLTELALL